MHAFCKLLSVYVFSYFPFGFEGRLWDLIVSVPDHCLSFYFAICMKKYFVPWLPMERPAKTLIFAGHTNESVDSVVYQLNNNKNQQNGKCAQPRLRSAHSFVMMQLI